MVSRILKYEETSTTANQTDGQIDSKSPPSTKAWEVQGVYSIDDTDHEYSLVLNERKLFDNLPAEDIADEDHVLPMNIRVEGGDDLSVLLSETGGNTANGLFYVVVDEA